METFDKIWVGLLLRIWWGVGGRQEIHLQHACFAGWHAPSACVLDDTIESADIVSYVDLLCRSAAMHAPAIRHYVVLGGGPRAQCVPGEQPLAYGGWHVAQPPAPVTAPVIMVFMTRMHEIRVGDESKE